MDQRQVDHRPEQGFAEWMEELQILMRGVEGQYQPLAQHMSVAAVRLTQEDPEIHDLNLVDTTLDELRRAFKVFLPYRDIRKVCLFGSARTREDDEDYQMALRFSEQITQKGFMMITGAGPGIMEAGNRGAVQDMSFGLNIHLPFEQAPNPYIANDSKLVSFKYFFNRKLVFLKESDATVLFPGGFGTHDEGFESLTLLQTGRCAPRPVILLSKPNDTYWKKWEDFVVTELCDKGFISREDLSLFSLATSAEEAVELTQLFYKNYHSIRYFRDLAVMRLNTALSPDVLKELNGRFKDLLLTGEFQMAALDQVALDRAVYLDKPRLIFRFDKMAYGRLCELIWFINKIES